MFQERFLTSASLAQKPSDLLHLLGRNQRFVEVHSLREGRHGRLRCLLILAQSYLLQDTVEVVGAARERFEVFDCGTNEGNLLDLLTVSFKELPKLGQSIDALQVLFKGCNNFRCHGPPVRLGEGSKIVAHAVWQTHDNAIAIMDAFSRGLFP